MLLTKASRQREVEKKKEVIIMRFDYIFLNYLLYFFYILEQSFNAHAVMVTVGNTYNRAVNFINLISEKLSNRDNLIRADTFTGKRNYANARGTLRRWAGTHTQLIGDIQKVVNRSAGFY